MQLQTVCFFPHATLKMDQSLINVFATFRQFASRFWLMCTCVSWTRRRLLLVASLIHPLILKPSWTSQETETKLWRRITPRVMSTAHCVRSCEYYLSSYNYIENQCQKRSTAPGYLSGVKIHHWRPVIWLHNWFKRMIDLFWVRESCASKKNRQWMAPP